MDFGGPSAAPPNTSPAADTGHDIGVKDYLPIPASNPPDATSRENLGTSDVLQGGQTLSHALAANGQNDQGLAQQDHDHQVLNLGWNEKKQDIAAPLVAGMDNEELWLLQIYHVKSNPCPAPGGLDLNIVDDEEFSPDKMRANIERFYMTVGVGLLAGVKHIARLRSWRETQRTACFAAAYFTAWLFDFLAPLLSAVLVVLIAIPESRGILFPPAPVSLVDSKTGGVQKPKAGVLGSRDSATGAPENHKGEAVEQEASNFVSSIASVALSSAAGKHPQGDQDSGENAATDAAPDPTALATKAADAKDKAAGSKPNAKHDKTKVPVETAMWSKMRPIMHAIGLIADTWERFANTLTPVPLFPSEVFRLRLVALLLPLVFGVSLFATPYIFLKSLSFFVGLIFFGDPLFSRGLDWLNHTIPNWQKLLEPRNTILKGVPTNAQLTLTLLRLGEANHAPLPPPPRISSPPPSEPVSATNAHLRSTGAEPPLNASQGELDRAIADGDGATAHQTGGGDIDAAREAKHGKKGGKILGFFRGTTRGFVKTAVGTDTVRAKAGNEPARDRLGVIPARHADVPVSGPVEFEARYEGRKGCVYISDAGTVPVLAFGEGSRSRVKIAGVEREDVHPVWSVPVGDVVEMKKVGGYGWKAKLVVGWSMEREVKDGLEIRTVDEREFKVTAVPLRDELFNRLVAMGAQKWEAW
ncbi:hypothetical protein MMYC01_204247 [Madurella mycetomatis]|uniref:Uncharacterized protein n=1 Tax=Madurella mycetomatis TaxID=100816 RepID=A0A175W947_9PEZI|nr:hypothetical protein MMYC01_204247 [Madurella mycetomatis]